MQNFPDNRDEKSLTAEEPKIAEENAKKLVKKWDDFIDKYLGV
jgi:hypothetical protein